MNLPVHPPHRGLQTLAVLAPGMVCVGYTIGPGAVAKLSAAGADTGFRSLWLLMVGAALCWVLLEASGRYAIVTGETALSGLRDHVRGGRWFAWLILVGALLAQLSGLSVLATRVAELTAGMVQRIAWGPSSVTPGFVLAVGAMVQAGIFGLIAIGRRPAVEKAMLWLVVLMVAGFAGAFWLNGVESVPGSAPVERAATAPDDVLRSGLTLLGISLAAPTFLMRAIWLNGRRNHAEPVGAQQRDAVVAAVVLFGIGAAVLGCAAGGPHRVDGLGGLAAGLFSVGILAAGLSSLIPMAMILPLLVADFRGGAPWGPGAGLRGWSAAACVFGAAGPLFSDWLPPLHRMASQVAQVLVLPLVVGTFLVLLNRTDCMGRHRAGPLLNAGMLAALMVSLALAWQGGLAVGRWWG